MQNFPEVIYRILKQGQITSINQTSPLVQEKKWKKSTNNLFG